VNRIVATVLAMYAPIGLIFGAAVVEQLVVAVTALVFAVLSLREEGALHG
jgi:hypothetical protein